MNGIYEKIEKWIPSKSDKVNIHSMLLNIYTYSLGIDFSSALDQFRDRIAKIDYDFKDNATSSGAICFFGAVIMSLLQLGYINNIDELFTFSSCYILLDHYIDDDTISSKEKYITINKINDFVETRDTTIDSPLIQAVADRYVNMVTKIPSAEQHLKNLFNAETKTMLMQKSDKLSREEYLHICEWKGGLTCIGIQALLELEITEEEYTLGSLIQMFDDILDIEDDLALGINTIATYDYKTTGCLDELLIYAVDKTESMDRKYNFFKPILYLGLVLGVHTNRDKYSSEMIEIMDNFIHYTPGTTKDEIMNWFQHKIEPHMNK